MNWSREEIVTSQVAQDFGFNSMWNRVKHDTTALITTTTSIRINHKTLSRRNIYFKNFKTCIHLIFIFENWNDFSLHHHINNHHRHYFNQPNRKLIIWMLPVWRRIGHVSIMKSTAFVCFVCNFCLWERSFVNEWN